ncbi:MAG: hypothetical protein U0470_05545 [Anaerolineae bacterium]
MFPWPQPWLTDIVFTDDRDMILGLRDRNGDRTLFEPGGALPRASRTASRVAISRWRTPRAASGGWTTT